VNKVNVNGERCDVEWLLRGESIVDCSVATAAMCSVRGLR